MFTFYVRVGAKTPFYGKSGISIRVRDTYIINGHTHLNYTYLILARIKDLTSLPYKV